MITDTQLQILGLILRYPDLHCSSIAQKLKLTPMAISKAVRELEKNKLVTIVAVGRSRVVRVKFNPEHLEYYSLAEKLQYRKHKLVEKLKQQDIEFAIIRKEECLVIAEKPIKKCKTITLQQFLSEYKNNQQLLVGERIIVNPYHFWKVILS